MSSTTANLTSASRTMDTTRSTFHTTSGTIRTTSGGSPDSSPGSDFNITSFVTDKVYMSIVWQNQMLSVAYYDMETMIIHMMPDSPESDEFILTKTVLHQINPSCIVIHAKQDERLTKVIENSVRARLSDDEESIIRILPSIDFASDLSRNRILQLNLPSIPKHYLESERFLYMSSLVPLDNVCMVRAAGGLIKYLNKMRVGIELENPDSDVPILSLDVFSLADHMMVNEETLSALQIFKTDFHPSVYKVGQGKEGLSVFGIMNRTKSRIGSKRLRMWFKQPLCNKTKIEERLDAVTYLKKPRNIEDWMWFKQPLCNKTKIEERLDAVTYLEKPRNIEATTTIQQCLKHIKPIARILNQMIQSQASINDWFALHKTTYNACCIAEVCRQLPQDIHIFHQTCFIAEVYRQLPQDIHIFHQIAENFTSDLNRIDSMISKIVDFELSREMNRFVVKQNVDDTLDEKKRFYHGLPSFLNKVAEQQLSELNTNIRECSIVYLPQLGYLLAVPINSEEIQSDEQLQQPGLQFVFHSNNMAHYKSPRAEELNKNLGDILCEIIDIETSIMHRLQNTIVGYTDILHRVMHYAAELDCIQALASCAREYNYTRPEFNDESIINITAGRLSSYMIRTSGPAAATGVIVYLSHIGSYIPADHASLPLCGHILTRIQSLDSVSTGLSTFMVDLNQMSAALRVADQNSLVLVDEFGKGTETSDGLAVLCACIHHWLDMGHESPHVFTMETLLNETELVFLYQLTDGQAECSFANHAALTAGLPDYIINRAKQVHQLRQDKMPIRRAESVSLQTYMERCHLTVNKFLDLDLEKDNVKSFLSGFVLNTMSGSGDHEM